MANETAEIVGLLKQRLAELDEERGNLERALREIGGGGSGTNRRPSTSEAQNTRRKRKRARSGPKTRAKKGQRRQQFLKAVEAKPGSKAGEIAKAIGVSANQAYGLANRLTTERAIEKRGTGYHLASKASDGNSKRRRRSGKNRRGGSGKNASRR